MYTYTVYIRRLTSVRAARGYVHRWRGRRSVVLNNKVAGWADACTFGVLVRVIEKYSNVNTL